MVLSVKYGKDRLSHVAVSILSTSITGRLMDFIVSSSTTNTAAIAIRFTSTMSLFTVLIRSYEAAILFVVDYLEKNQHMLNCVYDSVGRDELKIYLYEDFTEIARKIICTAESQLGKHISEDYRNLLVMFYTEGIVGIIT